MASLFQAMRENAFTIMKEHHFTPKDIETGDEYFFSFLGEDGVVHFHIKELPGWKFGMWLNDGKSETEVGDIDPDQDEAVPYIKFFAQHELFLDKFKPSRSEFVETIYCNSRSDCGFDAFYARNMIRVLKEMQYHPFLARYRDLYGLHGYISEHSIVLTVLKAWFRAYFYKFRVWLKNRLAFFYLKWVQLLCRHRPFCQSCEVIDWSKDDDCFARYPPFDIKIVIRGSEYDGEAKAFAQKYLDLDRDRLPGWITNLFILSLYDPAEVDEDGAMRAFHYVEDEEE